MPDTNILTQIRKLVELQKIDGQVYAVKRDLKEKPAMLKALEEHFESKKARLKDLEEKQKASLVQRKTLEGDLKAQEDAIVKTNAQLSLLKTNKEYQAKMTEIEGLKAAKSQIEEKILLSYDETDGVKTQIDQEKAVVAKEEEEYQKTKREVEATVKELQEKLAVLSAQRTRNIEGVDKSHLQRYDRVLVNKEGLAIVPLRNNVCGGCFMNIPHQVVNEIKMHEKMIYCEICARILYLEEDIEK